MHHPPPPPTNHSEPYRSSIAKVMRELFSEERRAIVLATLVGIAAGIGSALLVSSVNRAVEAGSTAQGLAFFSGLLLITLGASLLSQFLLIGISQQSIYRLRLRLTRGILGAELAHLESLGDHRLLASLTHDVRSIAQTMAVVPGLLVDVATIVSCFAYLAWLSGPVFASLAFALLICLWAFRSVTRRARHLFTVARDGEDALIAHFKTVTDGAKELKLNRERRERFVEHELESSASMLKKVQSRAMGLFALSDALSQFTLFVTLGLVVLVVPHYLPMSMSLVASFALTVTFMTMPFQNLLHRMPELLRGLVAVGKLDHMRLELQRHDEDRDGLSERIDADRPLPHNPSASSTAPCVAERATAYRPLERDCVIELEHVSYCYTERTGERGFRLGPLSLILRSGQITYLTGGNGSGKSTIAKILAGLYIPESGTVRLNGIVIEQPEREWYRQHFSAIFTDFHLFERCVGEDSGVTDAEIDRLLEELGLDGKVSVQDGTLSTLRLSQGQRKRLALLSAYLEDRPIYVFDEWAADQEPSFRETFYTSILPRLRAQGKLVLVITHDDRYFHLADQLLKLDCGEVENDELRLAMRGALTHSPSLGCIRAIP